jgi:hypothetical protein
MEPPVSLSLLPRTMRGETDVVTPCHSRLSKFGGGFSPAYRTFVMEQETASPYFATYNYSLLLTRPVIASLGLVPLAAHAAKSEIRPAG